MTENQDEEPGVRRLRAAGCQCEHPLVGWTSGLGPVCRFCGIRALLAMKEMPTP